MTEEEIAKNKEISQYISQSMQMSAEIMRLYTSALKSKNQAAIEAAQKMLASPELPIITSQLEKTNKTKEERKGLIDKMTLFIKNWKPKITIHTLNTEAKVRAN